MPLPPPDFDVRDFVGDDDEATTTTPTKRGAPRARASGGARARRREGGRAQLKREQSECAATLDVEKGHLLGSSGGAEAQLAELMAAAGDGDDDDADDDDETAPPRDDERAPGDASEDSLDDEGGEATAACGAREHNLSARSSRPRRAEQFESPRPHRSAGGARAGTALRATRRPRRPRTSRLAASSRSARARAGGQGRRAAPRRGDVLRRERPRPGRGHGGASAWPQRPAGAIAPSLGAARRPRQPRGRAPFMKRIDGASRRCAPTPRTPRPPARLSLEGVAAARRGRAAFRGRRGTRAGAYWGAADIARA